MEIVSALFSHWLETAVAVYLIGMVLYGHYRGFIRLAVSLVSLAAALLVVWAVMPYATDWIKNNTGLYESMKAGIEQTAGFTQLEGEPDEPSDVEASDEETADGDTTNEELPDEDTTNAEPSDEGLTIEGLELPEQIKRLLSENKTAEDYGSLGAEALQDYVGSYLADIMLRILVFVVLFLAIFILLRVLVFWLDLIAKLPILSGLNQIAGAVLGGLEGLVFVWIGCMILTLASGTGLGGQIMSQVDISPWLSWLYENNLLSYLVLGLLSLGIV